MLFLYMSFFSLILDTSISHNTFYNDAIFNIQAIRIHLILRIINPTRVILVRFDA